MKFLSAYSDFDANSLLNGYYSEEPSRTKQSFKEEVDINTLVKRFGITGQMPVPSRLPTYDDFTGIDDYQSALNALLDASAAFYDLSANVRRKFDNDPQQFLEYVNNPDNRESLYDLGLAIRPPADSGVAASGLPASAEGDPTLT